MTGIDWAIVAVVLLSVALAAAQGFFFEVFSLAGAIVGYLLAAWEYPRVALWYAPYVKSAWMANVAGFLTIFLAVVLFADILARIVRWGVKEAGLRWFDRALGAVFGLLRGVLFVTVGLVAVASWAPNTRWLARSQTAPYLLIVGRAAIWAAPGELRMQFRDGMKVLRDLRAGNGTEGPAGK